jgi:hypothetical protein
MRLIIFNVAIVGTMLMSMVVVVGGMFIILQYIK